MNSLGENIASLRKEKGMTQEALASEIGVSPQAVSKWENNTNMPDIQLLPILADLFDVSLDRLFGREKGKREFYVADVFDECCEAMMNTIGTAFYNSSKFDINWGISEPVLSVDKYLERYKANLKYAYNGILRSGIVQKENIVYYRHQFGGLLMRKPEAGWASLFVDEAAVKMIVVLADPDFRKFMAELLKSEKSTFTASSICRRCGLGGVKEIEEKLVESGMFRVEKVEMDDREVAIYDLISSDKMFLIFNLLMCSKEFAEYRSSYYNYSGTGDYMHG